MSDNPKVNPANLLMVSPVDRYKTLFSVTASKDIADGSKTLSELGATISEDAAGVIIYTAGDTFHMEVDGTAATTSQGLLPTMWVEYGGKAYLDTIELLAAADSSVINIFVFGER